ncbi:MAG: hypothetical protein HC802_12025 [Caldilineaceae bacterium]|nr:hypothetical protein [Caldilineaceae bacterium]
MVAAGGDGTISEVMNGLARATPAGETVGKLGILPLGTGNDFADIIGCQRNLFEAAQLIGRGRTRRVDLGYAKIVGPDIQRDRYFDNNMGVGFEAHVTLESYSVKWLSGVSLYVVAALKSLRSYHAPQVEMSWEDEGGRLQHHSQRVLLVTVGNSPRTGGGFYLTPDALLDDGLLDIGILDNVSRWRILGLLPKALKAHTPTILRS